MSRKIEKEADAAMKAQERAIAALKKNHNIAFKSAVRAIKGHKAFDDKILTHDEKVQVQIAFEEAYTAMAKKKGAAVTICESFLVFDDDMNLTGIEATIPGPDGPIEASQAVNIGVKYAGGVK